MRVGSGNGAGPSYWGMPKRPGRDHPGGNKDDHAEVGNDGTLRRMAVQISRGLILFSLNDN